MYIHICRFTSFTLTTRLLSHTFMYICIHTYIHRDVVYVFSICNAGGSVCGCMCVYMHTDTHTAHMGYSDVSPRVGMRHLEGPKNLDGLNLGIHIFVYVYRVPMCMYMHVRGVMRSCTSLFFL